MKNPLFVLALIVSLCVFSSCKDGANPDVLMPLSASSTRALDVDEEIADINVDKSQIKEIKVPSVKESFSLYDVIDSLVYVPLETTSESLLGRIDKIESDASFLFVLDKDNNNAMRFSAEGKYLGPIGQEGEGKGQYTQISDMSLDKQNQQICLLDAQSGKLLFYSYDGRFIKEDPLYYYYQEVEFSKGFMIENTSFAYNKHVPQIDCNKLVISNRQQQPISKGFPYSERQRTDFHWALPNALTTLNGKVYYNHILSNSIWVIDGNTCKGVYKISLPNGCGSLDMFNTTSITDNVFEQKLDQSPMAYRGEYLQTSNVLYIKLSEDGVVKPVFYNKSSGKILFGNAFPERKNNLFETFSGDIFDFANDDCFIKVIQPFDIFKIMKESKGITPSNKEKVLLDKINEESNPVLVFVKLRNF